MEEGNMPPRAEHCIGVFDSGVGGLSVAKEIRRLLPAENIQYYADTLNMPYGPKPLAEVRRLAVNVAEALLRLPAKAVVVACNTASAAALATLREMHPGRIFIGMVPAVKPAAEQSGTRRVGVLATEATLRGALFADVVAAFAGDAEVLAQPCPGLAERIETHAPGDPEVTRLVESFVRPLVAGGADMIVLGCTHYALVKGEIARVAGEGVEVIDPAPAVARRVRAVLEERGLLAERAEGQTGYIVSGDREAFLRAAGWYM